MAFDRPEIRMTTFGPAVRAETQGQPRGAGILGGRLRLVMTARAHASRSESTHA